MTQTSLVLAHLRTGASLTPLEALERWGCFRLAARIDELKREGHEIDSHIVRSGKKHWASYTLRQPVQRELFAETRVGIT